MGRVWALMLQSYLRDDKILINLVCPLGHGNDHQLQIRRKDIL